LPGATSSSYTLGSSNVGTTVRVTVTAENAGGSASATSSVTSVVSGEGTGECDVTWTGEAGDGLWQTSGNWSAGSIPTSEERVCIPAGATVEISGGANAAASITGEGSLAMTGGSLELTDAAQTSTLDTLLLREATLTGPGTLDVEHSLRLAGSAAMTGSGATVLANGATGLIEASSGCEPMSLSARTLVNEGTLTYVWGTRAATSPRFRSPLKARANPRS
jgi:hypothetical protein